MKFCPKCGTERTGRFCGGCGFAYEDIAETPLASPVVEQPSESFVNPAPQPLGGLIYGPGFSDSTHCTNCGEPRQPEANTCSLCGIAL